MQVVKKIGIIFIVSLLIMATGGFSVYRHVCHCADEMTASFFRQESCEHQNPSRAKSCCRENETRSCCSEEPVKEKKHTCHKSDCCKTTSLFLKINDSYQPGVEKTSLKPVVVLTAVLFIDISKEILSVTTSNLFNADLPPPHTGKELLTAMHQLKLDPHLV
jgi:hypothetical protein